MYVTGVFPVSFGGDIGFLLGIVTDCGEMHVAREDATSLLTLRKHESSAKMRMFWIHGSARRYGRSRLWAGRMKRRI